MRSQYTDLKIYREYLWGAVKTRQVLCGFDAVKHLRTHHPTAYVTTVLFHDQDNRQFLLTKNFHDPAPIWKPEKIRTQVKIFNRVRFFLPEILDNLLIALSIRNHQEEVNQLAWLIAQEKERPVTEASEGA